MGAMTSPTTPNQVPAQHRAEQLQRPAINANSVYLTCRPPARRSSSSRGRGTMSRGCKRHRPGRAPLPAQRHSVAAQCSRKILIIIRTCARRQGDHRRRPFRSLIMINDAAALPAFEGTITATPISVSSSSSTISVPRHVVNVRGCVHRLPVSRGDDHADQPRQLKLHQLAASGLGRADERRRRPQARASPRRA